MNRKIGKISRKNLEKVLNNRTSNVIGDDVKVIKKKLTIHLFLR